MFLVGSIDGYATTSGVVDTPKDGDSVMEVNEMYVDRDNQDEDFGNVDVDVDNNNSLENASSK